MTPEEFRQNRVMLGMNQKELAKELGLRAGQSYISRIERESGPSESLAKHIQLLVNSKKDSVSN